MTVTAHERPTAPPIWFLAICTASAVVGLTILSPALPLIKTELAVSSEAVQKLLTVYLVAIAAGQLVCGPISDRVGRRPVLLLGSALFCVAALFAMLTQNITYLTILRTIQGLGAAACMAMGRAIVNDVFVREEAARQMSTISMVLAIAPILSLAFGGLIAQTAGWQGAMGLLAFSGMVVFVAGFYLLAETNLNRVDRINIGSVLTAYRNVLRNKVFVAWAMSGGMTIGIFFSLNAFLAYQYQRHGYTMAEFGLWFALTPASYVIGNTANRNFFVKKGIELAASIGCVLGLFALIILYVTQAMGLTHALSLALPCCLFGFANGIVVANTTVGAISASGNNAGTGAGIVGAWQMAASGIAGALIASLGGAQHFSITAITLITMAIIAVASMSYVLKQTQQDQ